jgi:hypothetical protein
MFILTGCGIRDFGARTVAGKVVAYSQQHPRCPDSLQIKLIQGMSEDTSLSISRKQEIDIREYINKNIIVTYEHKREEGIISCAVGKIISLKETE